MNHIIYLCILCFSFFLSGCSNHAIRFQLDDCDMATSLCKEYYKLHSTSPRYSLFFVEFDDQGHVHNRERLNDVIDSVKNKGNEQDIILYIHGWKHNARHQDQNVKAFKRILARAAKRAELFYSNREVTGIYLGWRGDSIPVGVLNNIPFGI